MIRGTIPRGTHSLESSRNKTHLAEKAIFHCVPHNLQRQQLQQKYTMTTMTRSTPKIYRKQNDSKKKHKQKPNRNHNGSYKHMQIVELEWVRHVTAHNSQSVGSKLPSDMYSSLVTHPFRTGGEFFWQQMHVQRPSRLCSSQVEAMKNPWATTRVHNPILCHYHGWSTSVFSISRVW